MNNEKKKMEERKIINIKKHESERETKDTF